MQDNESQQKSRSLSRPRRLNGLFIMLLIVAGLTIFAYRPSIERIHCDKDILDSKPEVIMLGTWWCQYCYQARRYFTDHQIRYCEYDIEQSAEGEKLFNDANARAIPVFLIGRYTISGFDETQLEQVLHRVREAS